MTSPPTDPAAVVRPRVAIVGTGGIAKSHVRALREVDRSDLVACVDIDADTARAFAAEWSIPNHHGDLGDLLATDPPDVIHLCTPPGSHRALAVRALEAGVTVLCEKPPAMTLADMDAIIAAETASSASFGTVFQHRFGSAGQRLRRLVADNALGQPMSAVCNTLWFRAPDYFDPEWRGVWGNEGGGPTLGHGIHQTDLLLAILGPWSRVTAVAKRQARPTNTEDLSAAIVEFENGAVATVLTSLMAPRESSNLRFDFELATVEVEHTYGYDETNWRFTAAADGNDAAWQQVPSAMKSGHAAQFAAVADALETGAPLPVTSAESRLTLELVAATYAAAFTQKPVARGEIGPDSPFHGAMDGRGMAPWDDVKDAH
ncbi:Gfo/Idh/MocA family protein [Propionibacteriaceae bacterium Y2011]|uniref:Gfo/Idh/MocA family protein n=1 Tax=Microlunatus sp. Y2014 TaxID=3418488 RepID=UPI003B4EE101